MLFLKLLLAPLANMKSNKRMVYYKTVFQN
jgi:hypothetical protein